MENLHTKFLIDYQEKITKIDLINTQLDAIKKSVNAFNKKKKFCMLINFISPFICFNLLFQYNILITFHIAEIFRLIFFIFLSEHFYQ